MNNVFKFGSISVEKGINGSGSVKILNQQQFEDYCSFSGLLLSIPQFDRCYTKYQGEEIVNTLNTKQVDNIILGFVKNGFTMKHKVNMYTHVEDNGNIVGGYQQNEYQFTYGNDHHITITQQLVPHYDKFVINVFILNVEEWIEETPSYDEWWGV